MSNAETKSLPGAVAPSGKHNFDEVLQSTIKETLTGVFGNRSARTIIRTMERVHSLRLIDVPEKGQMFNSALKEILGTGHQIIEDLILENFSIKLGQKFEYIKEYAFADYINNMKGSK